jgi:hypothetical protein
MKFKKLQFKKLIVASSTAFAAAASTASMAAIDAGVNTALTDAKADVATLGGLVLVVLVAAAAFKYMRRAL